MKKLAPIIFTVLLAFWMQPAFAYIDPGSGSAIMSAIVGLFVAVGLAIKTYWYKLKSLITGKKPKNNRGEEQNSKKEIDS